MSYLHAAPPPTAQARLQSPLWSFNQHLLRLYQSHPALYEGSFRRLATNNDDQMYAFVRERGRDKVIVVVNLSDQPRAVALQDAALTGAYREVFTGRTASLPLPPLAPWGYQIFVGRGA